MNGKDFALWCLLSWLWGSSFLAIGIGVQALPPLLLVAGRLVIGALCLVAFLYARGRSLRLGARGWVIATVVGTSGNVLPFLLISFSEQHVDSGIAALIMGIAPVVTLTVAPLMHADETLGRRQAVGAILGFAGLLVLVGPEAIYGLGGDIVPQLALVGAALCYSFTALVSRRFAHPDALQMSAASVLVGAVITGGLAAATVAQSGVSLPSPGSSLAVIYLGFGPTALAALIYFRLIPRIGAGRLQQVNYVVPVLGTVLGAIFLGERPGPNALIAIAVIVAAVYLVSSRAPKAMVSVNRSDT